MEGGPVPVDVQTFESPFGKARAVIFSDGTPWFVAKDVCEGLGLSGGSMSTHMGRLKFEQKQVIDLSSCSKASIKEALYSGRGQPRMLIISRGGFNDLVLESRKPVAREYRQWVTDEVLPALQDTGTFTEKNHPATLSGTSPTQVIVDEVAKVEEDFRGRRYHEPNAASFPLNEDDILRWAAEIASTRLAEKRANG